MLEKEIERYFIWHVEKLGGKSYKFTSPAHRGVSDRVACLPDGTVWFVELKRPGGKLSPLQLAFAAEMQRLNQRYACLYSKEDVERWNSGLIRK